MQMRKIGIRDATADLLVVPVMLLAGQTTPMHAHAHSRRYVRGGGLFRNLVIVYLNLDCSPPPPDLSIWFQVGKLVESCLGEVMETLGC